MFIAANLLSALASMLNMILQAYSFVLIIYCIISWVNPDPFNPIVQFLRGVNEPVLAFIRRFIPPLGPLDMSAIVAFLAIILLREFVVRSLYDFSVMLR